MGEALTILILGRSSAVKLEGRLLAIRCDGLMPLLPNAYDDDQSMFLGTKCGEDWGSHTETGDEDGEFLRVFKVS